MCTKLYTNPEAVQAPGSSSMTDTCIWPCVDIWSITVLDDERREVAAHGASISPFEVRGIERCERSNLLLS